MEFYDIRLPSETAWYAISEIGNFGKVCWLDLCEGQASTQRPFFEQLQQIDALTHTLDQIEQQCREVNLPVTLATESDCFYRNLGKQLAQREKEEKKSPHTFFNEIQDLINSKYIVLADHIESYRKILRDVNQQADYLNFLHTIKPFMDVNLLGCFNDLTPQGGNTHLKDIQLEFLFGIIHTKNIQRAQKLVFRITRGNSYLYLCELESKYKIDPNGENAALEASVQFICSLSPQIRPIISLGISLPRH